MNRKNRSRRRLPLGNVEKWLFQAVIGISPRGFAWQRVADVIHVSLPPLSRKVNVIVQTLRSEGYRTLGDLGTATGILMTTLRSWECRRLPVLQRSAGYRVISIAEFETLV